MLYLKKYYFKVSNPVKSGVYRTFHMERKYNSPNIKLCVSHVLYLLEIPLFVYVPYGRRDHSLRTDKDGSYSV